HKRVKSAYSGKPVTSTPTPSKPSTPASTGSYTGKRVESIYKGKDGLNFYNKASFDSKHKVGVLAYGIGFPEIVSKVKVGTGHMYKVKNSKGKVYYVTASSKYVKVVGKGKPAKKPSKPSTSSTSYKVGSKVSIKKSASKYATGEKIPSKYKNKKYTVQQV